jgi:LL-diaminopimelate aminotransferase
MITTAMRIQNLPPYLFARIDKIKQDALREGIDLIDLGVGDPDVSPPKAVVDALVAGVSEAGSHNYSSYEGLPGLRIGFAEWFKKRFAVTLNPRTEVLPLLGSKEGIGHIFFSHIDPGDEVLIPDPGYPVYTAGAIMTGAVPKYFPLRRGNGFLPDIGELETIVTPKTKMMWLNYPSNPTTAMATMEMFTEVVAFARNHGIMVCHDAAYSEIAFDGAAAGSMLQVPDARDVGIEFHSLSKTFCMPGWRVGFIVGNADIIEALARVKTNLDSGIFLPIQRAAMTALSDCGDDTKKIRNIFEARRNLFVNGLKSLGWDLPMPSSTFYVWAPVPGIGTSMEFCMLLLKNAGIVATPGVGFGDNGEGYVRMSLTVSDERLEEALTRIKKMNLDGFVKSPISALRCISRHCGVP